MIDIHSHVLPLMDDGSQSAEESLSMLSALAAQGVSHVAATPHFYPSDNSPEEFLRRRQQSYDLLKDRLTPELPQIHLGAEGYYYSGISRNADIRQLCIAGTSLLLLEMPFSPWNDRMVEEILLLQEQSGITVLLAHIERYLGWQRMSVFIENTIWQLLRDAHVLTQCNTHFFLDRHTYWKAMWMLRSHRVNLIATDTHNMSGRAPQFAEAMQAIGADGRRILTQNLRKDTPELWKWLETKR